VQARLIVLLGALAAIAPLSIDMYLPAFPAIAADLDVPATAVALTLTAILVGLAVGQVIAGPVADAVGRRRPLLVGLALYVTASLVCAVAPSAALLTAARLGQGLAGAVAVVLSRAIVRDLHAGAEAARFLSLMLLVNGVAPILAPVIGAVVLAVTGWRGVFILLAILGAALAASVAVGLPETLPHGRRHGGGVATSVRAFGPLLRDRRFVGLALCQGLALGAMFAYIAGSPFLLQDVLGVSPAWFAVAFGVNALGIVALGQANARVVADAGPRALLGVGLTLAFGGALLLLAGVLAGSGLVVILPALFAVVASIGLVYPNATALALEDQPHVAGTAASLLGLVQFALGAVAAPIVGLGGGTAGLPMAATVFVMTALAALVFLTIGRPPADLGIVPS
jgi:DHA1 family bicyclomycin/chloramphenicol resistance-like MFS transporter